MRRFILFVLSLLLLSYYGNSQIGNTPTTVSTPRGNVQSERYTYRQPGQPYMLRISKKKKFNPKTEYEIRIVLQNDSVMVAGCKLETTNSKQTITCKDKVITPGETKEIIFPAEEDEYLKGVPKDSCWLFKTTSGPISAYATTPQADTKEIVAIQKFKGEIMPVSKELLLEWLKSDPKAIKLVEKGNYMEAIKLYNQ